MAGKILIAVDFGTTYSAIAYTHLQPGIEARRAVLTVVDTGWPGQGHQRSHKLPTVFKMDGNTFRYGFEAQEDPERIAFPKLYLDPCQIEKAIELTRFTATRGVDDSEASRIHLMEGVTKYFRALKEVALRHMESHSRWERSFIDNTPREFVLTVPAIWSDCAKDRTLRCALNAGYGVLGSVNSIRLVAEPEAAAMYTISSLPTVSLEQDDIILVCDAGGGTVDLATYKIAKLHPLDLQEFVISTGDLCGSILLNTQFLTLVESKLNGHTLSPSARHDIEKEFNEEIKPRFTADETEDAYMAVPPDGGWGGATLRIPAAEMRELFERVILRVIGLLRTAMVRIRESMGAVRKVTILLVGGFGGSEYLTERVNGEFGDVEVYWPPDAWSAVVRGALLRGLVSKRKIRAAYGVVFRERWSRSTHERGVLAEYAAAKKVLDRYEETYFCDERMKWYVKKGLEFTDSTTVSFPFYRVIGLFHPLKFNDDIYVYHEGHEGSDGPPMLDMDCHRLATLRSDLSTVPGIRDRLERRTTSTGTGYYKINYALEMCFDTVIRFRVRFEGNVVGEAEIDYVEGGECGREGR